MSITNCFYNLAGEVASCSFMLKGPRENQVFEVGGI